MLAVLLALVSSQVVARSDHWTDERTGAASRKRTIGNWLNYQDQNGAWAASDVAVEAGDASGDSFEHQAVRSPLQVFLGDQAGGGNTARIGLRLSRAPGHWVQMQAVGVEPNTPKVVNASERSASWSGLWTNSTLTYRAGRGRAEKLITLSAAGHPTAFRFAIRLPAGFSYVINADSSVSFRNAQGVEWLRSPVPWGRDANGVPIRVTVVAAPDITTARGTFPTLRIVPNATDLAGATYPVEVDPTTTISGTTAISDTNLQNGGDWNLGGYSDEFCMCAMTGAGRGTWRGLWRINSAFPAGTITGFRFRATRRYSVYCTGLADTVTFYQVKSANAWVEGTAAFSAQTGSSDWTHLLHNTTTWAGSAGCGTSGTDYFATPTGTYDFPQWTGGAGSHPDEAFSVTLPTSWVTDWRDGLVTNNGIFAKVNQENNSKGIDIYATESASKQPTFEIDYDPPPAGGDGQGRHIGVMLNSQIGRMLR